jgi:hypothetical protein
LSLAFGLNLLNELVDCLMSFEVTRMWVVADWVRVTALLSISSPQLLHASLYLESRSEEGVVMCLPLVLASV